MQEKDLFQLLGHNVKLCRSRYAWSQEELAEKINVSVNFVSAIETGRRWVSPTTMLKLAEAFGLAVYELLKPPASPPPESLNLLTKYNRDACNLLNNLHQKYLVQFCQVK
ncbi:MAG: helix-turn-helix domain-containing protein [Candidatus Margulisbacteria bacterium]|jgi:transcriptional regulator with XRE-family HTH domain|nr:helix-turn-helix domain-containing protein [Candidatus Margulisiibacteriota bacterium]